MLELQLAGCKDAYLEVWWHLFSAGLLHGQVRGQRYVLLNVVRHQLAHLLLSASLQGSASLAASMTMLPALTVSGVLSLTAIPK